MGMSLRAHDRACAVGGVQAVYALRLYAVWTITTSLAGLQWAVLFFLHYLLFRRIFGHRSRTLCPPIPRPA